MANAAGEIFKAVREAGVSADLVSPFGDSSIPNVKHHRLSGLGYLAFTPKIVSLAKNYDLIHLHYPCYGNAFMVSLARTLGAKAPLVVSYHMDTVGRGLRRPVFAFHSKFLAPGFLKSAAKIAVASRDYAASSLLGKIPGLMSKVVEIPFGVDSKRFSPLIPLSNAGEGVSPSSPLPNLGECASSSRPSERFSPTTYFLPYGRKDVNGKNILFVGGLDEQHYFKGLHVLLDALAKIPDARLTVVGSGGLVKFYARRAFELAIGERVIFAGRVSDEELPEYYRSADVFCLPSLDRSEAFGIVLMEAAASGVPSVATDIPGVRSVVKNNETGLLVPPGDAVALAGALNSILNDSQLAAKLGAAARACALNRTWKGAGQAYADLYREILLKK
jgi:glycosyltransferase involved in cell wall biosynthesis